MTTTVLVEPYGNIHDYSVADGKVTLDDHGEPMIGFYYQIMDGDNKPLSELMGPYNSGSEAESACQLAFERGDY